jgi:F-box-like
MRIPADIDPWTTTDKSIRPFQTHSPVESLPPELLIEIFACCAFIDPLAPLVLRRVSKWWRAIASSSPRVWQFVYLDDSARSIQSLRTQAEVWLERSVPLLIDVELNVESLDLILPMLSPLLPAIERWRSFKMSGQRDEHITKADLPIARESLESLHIFVHDDSGGLPKETFKSEWPSHFIMNVWLLDLPRSQLLAPLRFTNIFITEDLISDVHMQPRIILDFLTACPELETFFFSGRQAHDDPPETGLPVVHLPNLHALQLKNTCLTRAILSSLYTPNLAHLCLAHLNVEFELPGDYHQEGDSEDEAHDFSQSPASDHATGMGLRKLLSRCRPPIKVFEMDFSDMRTKDFKHVWDRLPLLESFSIVASDMSDKVINLLKPFKLPGTDDIIHIRLPRLHHLALYNCQRLSGDAIVEALTARVRYTDAYPSQSLVEVAVVTCDGFTHHHGQILAGELGDRLRLV